MHTRRSTLLAAAALLVATALAGAAARGVGRAPAGASHMLRTAPESGAVAFRGTLDRRAVLLGEDGLVRMELTMAAAPDAAARVRRPTDLVIILDRSGSMSGEKIIHARAAVAELLAQLGADDRFALVTYADDATLAIPLSPVSEPQRAAWLGAIAEIQPGGGTAMSAGLDRGLDVVLGPRAGGRVPHVILISDGLANQGDATPEGLTRRARRAAAGELMLSTVGVGLDFNEYLMTALADAGTGNYYYVEDPRELAAVFARELDAARATVASALAIEVAPAPGVRVVDAAGYPLEVSERGVVFRPGSLFAGQERRIWVTLAVPHDVVGEYDLGRVSLTYGAGGARTTVPLADLPRIACVRGEAEYYATFDVPAWSRAVAVDEYNKMQEEVAGAVKAGRRDEAMKKLATFRDSVEAMNQRLRSPAVAAQLEEAKDLETRVADSFAGAQQAARQNALSKTASAAAADARRPGAKK